MVQTLQQPIIRFREACQACGGAIRLYAIEAHPTIETADLRTFVCTSCDGVQTQVAAQTRGRG